MTDEEEEAIVNRLKSKANYLRLQLEYNSSFLKAGRVIPRKRISKVDTKIQYEAYRETHKAIARGTLKKASKCKCEICGNKAKYNHHDDYSKPLEVTPLCGKCHKNWHKVNGRGKNASMK